MEESLFFSMQITQSYIWSTIWKRDVNMKLILCMFKQLSGLKINFTRVEYFFGPVKEEEQYKHYKNCVDLRPSVLVTKSLEFSISDDFVTKTGSSKASRH